ncbi:hypothetical protein SBI67_01115 [Mycolicibacterium sp. 120266]|uniref:hypothetical protein n=1 Tax=Mycolicibacterium sp. 120266 TaxID=3090601 RepID=UPI00299F0BD5|nr:hypothetical protein [Mycolicibacterium sp. 120266]MDX1870708.1 hypothetical protein [Mycolicibacterium sp. 120266]
MTTTSHDEGAPSDELTPPTALEVLRELRALRSRDGLTADKVRHRGPHLQRLAMSRDELAHSGAGEDGLPGATIRALRCAVQSYLRGPQPRTGHNFNWVVLHYELNLTQASGLGLEARIGEARNISGVGEDVYANKAKAILENFAFDIAALSESLCREPAALREARRIARLSEDERVRQIYFLLVGSGAFHDGTLASALPNLFEINDRLKTGANDDPAALAGAAVESAGSSLYDQFATRIVTFTRETAFIPWAQLRPLLGIGQWPPNTVYAEVARTLDTMVRRGAAWPHGRWPRDPNPKAAYVPDFFSYATNTCRPFFWQTLRRSLNLLARIVVWVDKHQQWFGNEIVAVLPRYGATDVDSNAKAAPNMELILSVPEIDPREYDDEELQPILDHEDDVDDFDDAVSEIDEGADPELPTIAPEATAFENRADGGDFDR